VLGFDNVNYGYRKVMIDGGRPMKSITLSVPDMGCGGCVDKVKNALLDMDGVTSAEVSLEEKRAVVETEDGVSAEELAAAVEAAGYGATVMD
jgi:copper chaperone CopZ